MEMQIKKVAEALAGGKIRLFGYFTAMS